MFEKIRKKMGTGKSLENTTRLPKCLLCTRDINEANGAEWILVERGDGKKAYMCTDCAFRTHEIVEGIVRTYQGLAVAAVTSMADEAKRNEEAAKNAKGAKDAAGNGNQSVLFTEDGQVGEGIHSDGTEDGTGEEGGKDVQEQHTPQSIFDHLGECVVGQEHARKVIAVALYNHWKRIQAAKDEGEGVQESQKGPSVKKSNILLLGPTGTGKTLLAETAAGILDIPFASIDATSLSETGYKGNDVEMAIERLVDAADGDIEKAERGIVYIDEIDKLAAGKSYGRSVGAEGVQQALLKLIEGTTVTLEGFEQIPGTQMMAPSEYEVDTSNILFICGGAFVGLQEDIKKRAGKTAIGFAAAASTATAGGKGMAGKAEDGITNADLEKYGIIPELAGRLPVKAILEPLGKEDLVRILTEPKDAVMGQYQAMLAADGVELSYTKEALERIAERALKEKAGARGLKSIMEDVTLETMFRAPGLEGRCAVTLTADDVDGVTKLEDRLGETPLEEKEPGKEMAPVKLDDGNASRPERPIKNIRKKEAQDHARHSTTA